MWVAIVEVVELNLLTAEVRPLAAQPLVDLVPGHSQRIRELKPA